MPEQLALLTLAVGAYLFAIGVVLWAYVIGTVIVDAMAPEPVPQPRTPHMPRTLAACHGFYGTMHPWPVQVTRDG